MGGEAYFHRHLSPGFESALAAGQPLRFLLEGATIHGEDGVRLVPHPRDGNSLMLYAGLTRVLDLVHLEDRQEFVPSAARAYEMHRHGVQPRYPAADVADLARDLNRYLSAVTVRARFYEREGRCTAWLSRRFGPDRLGADDWAVIDSESVLGFADSQAREGFWAPILERGRGVLEVLAKSPKLFGRGIATRRFGGELDLLLWDPVRREFLVVEVKDGSSADGIYLSPLQVGCYLAAWRRFALEQPDEALSGLTSLLAQRQRLGMVHGPCQLPRTRADLRFRPVIVVQDPKERSSCWARLQMVQRAVQDAWQPAERPHLEGLSICAVVDGQLADITQQCPQWPGGHGCQH